jgi:plastocyanin
MERWAWVPAFAVALGAAGCGEGSGAASEGGRVVAAAQVRAPAVQPTGNVIPVKMISGSGERFEPSAIEAAAGDVLRFVLEVGVHNVSFPAADNPSGVRLPDSSPYLQLPGQTWDLLVDLPPGTYTFVCDPHAAMGMVGTLTVRD